MVYFECDSKGHLFSKNGKILCPKANNPVIKANADAKFKDISERSNKLTGLQERWQKTDPDLNDFNGKSLKKIKFQVIAANTDSSTIETIESNRRYNSDHNHSYYGPGRKNRSAGGHDD